MADASNAPYRNLPPEAFWRTGVAERDTLDPGRLFKPKFPVTRDMHIATAGSCFAQHVGRALRQNRFRVIDREALPPRMRGKVTAETAGRFGYGMYSARYGNIYTARQLLQLDREAAGDLTPADRVWERDGRFYDAQRPNVEPQGHASPQDVIRHRTRHLAAVRKAFSKADLFVFTLGLTEAWLHRRSGTVFPTAPGTIAGRFDPDIYAFHNFSFAEILEDFLAFRGRLMKRNRDVRFLVTVSPVPLTATMSGQHVEVATSYSKAVLRAVAGELWATCDNVDYFPSYEIITSQNARGAYYCNNMRSVSSKGVSAAMNVFFEAHGMAPSDGKADQPSKKPRKAPSAATEDTAEEDVICEDALLEAFGR